MTSTARATQVMAIGTVLSRVTGFGRLFALAYAFGFTRLTDSYNLANTTPNIVYELVLGGVLSSALVPLFVRHLRDDDGEGVSAVVTAAAVGAVALSALLVVAAPLFIRLYTLGDPDGAAVQRDVATTLLRFFAPQVAIYAVITITAALLNGRDRYAAPMFAPVVANLVIIGVLLAAPRLADGVSIGAVRGQSDVLLLLGLGTTAGYLLQAAAQVAALRGTGIRLRWRWNPRHRAVRSLVRVAGWTAGFTIANQVALWVVLLLANRREGGVSAYQAAQVFFQLPHAIVAVSVMTALLPDLARRWQSDDRRGFDERVGWGVRALLATIVPAAAGYVIVARPLVGAVLQHGALGAGDARLTADLLALLAVGLPGFSAFLLLVRAHLAMEDGRAVFRLYLLENAVNVALGVALFPRLGVRGLAVAYAAAYAVGAAAAWVSLRRRVGGTGSNAAIGGTALRVAAATAAMAAVAVAAGAAVGGETGGAALTRVAVAIAAGVTVFLGAARVFRIDELNQLLRLRGEP